MDGEVGVVSRKGRGASVYKAHDATHMARSGRRDGDLADRLCEGPVLCSVRCSHPPILDRGIAIVQSSLEDTGERLSIT